MLAGVWADGPRVGDHDTNCAGANRVAAGWGPIREIGVRARDIQGFLPKSKLTSWLI